jgi:uncharacterized protein (DUF433 family)
MDAINVGEHLVIDPEVMHGQLTFKGTRVPVSTVMAFLELGRSVDDIVADWPQLAVPAVREAIRLATEALLCQHAPSLSAAKAEARRRRDGRTPAAVVP